MILGFAVVIRTRGTVVCIVAHLHAIVPTIRLRAPSWNGYPWDSSKHGLALHSQRNHLGAEEHSSTEEIIAAGKTILLMNW